MTFPTPADWYATLCAETTPTTTTRALPCDWCDEPAAWLLTDTTPQGEPHAHTDHACTDHAMHYAHTYQATATIRRTR